MNMVKPKAKYWLAHHKALGSIYCECGMTPMMGYHNGEGWYILGRRGDCYPFIKRVFPEKKDAKCYLRYATGRRISRIRKTVEDHGW